jgi:hypothetical protein
MRVNRSEYAFCLEAGRDKTTLTALCGRKATGLWRIQAATRHHLRRRELAIQIGYVRLTYLLATLCQHRLLLLNHCCFSLKTESHWQADEQRRGCKHPDDIADHFTRPLQEAA